MAEAERTNWQQAAGGETEFGSREVRAPWTPDGVRRCPLSYVTMFPDDLGHPAFPVPEPGGDVNYTPLLLGYMWAEAVGQVQVRHQAPGACQLPGRRPKGASCS